MRLRKKWIFTILCLLCIALTGTLSFAASSGTCSINDDNSNVSWLLSDDGTLTISGSGQMTGFSPVIGDEEKKTIKKIIIGNGVTSILESAFSGCSNLTTISIADSVTSIDDYAFSSCKSMTSITIPNSVTSVGKCIFYNCSNLKNITLSNKMTYISSKMFESCSSLTSISLPNSVTQIGERAFSSCHNLENITLPNNLSTIGACAFSSCSGLTSISLPNSVTDIGAGAFDGCSLTSISIPNGVTSIKSQSFLGCEFTNIIIPNKITSIGLEAFARCSYLRTTTIPSSVNEIGTWAFAFCENLTSITIPNSVTKIGEEAFKGCPNLTIYGESGSYAEKYAKENNIPFKLIGSTSSETDAPITGDNGESSKQITPPTVPQPTAKTYKITFNLNGKNAKFAKGAKKTKNVTNGKKLGTLPKATRTGYVLLGWFTDKKKGTQIKKDTTVLLSKNKTYFAHWGYKVIFDANGGTFDKDKTKSKNYKVNQKYGDLPVPTKNKYAFAGWYTKKKGGTLVKSSDKCKKNITLYAHWGYKVILVPNGARISKYSVVEVPEEKYIDLPTLKRSGYTFAGWYTKNKGGKKITNNKTTVDLKKDTYLYAHWERGNVNIKPENDLTGAIKIDSLAKKLEPEYYDIIDNGSIGYSSGYFTFTKGNKTVAISKKAVEGKKGYTKIEPIKKLSDKNFDKTHEAVLTYREGNTWTFAKFTVWAKLNKSDTLFIKIRLDGQMSFLYTSGNTIRKRSTVFHITDAPYFFFNRFEYPFNDQLLINTTVLVSETKGDIVFDSSRTVIEGLPIKKPLEKMMEFITISKDVIGVIKDIYDLKAWKAVKDTIELSGKMKKSDSIYESGETMDLSPGQQTNHTLTYELPIGLCHAANRCEITIEFPRNASIASSEFMIQFLVNSIDKL